MRKAMLEARQEVSRQAVIQAASRLFTERGVSNTSLSDIAEAMGVTKAALYYYFSSKQEIIVETVTANVTRFLAEVMAPLPGELGAVDTLLARIDRKLDRVESVGRDELRLFYTVMLEQLDEPEIEKVYREFWEQGRADARATFERGQREGEIRSDVDPAAATNVLEAIVMGVDILWLNDPEHVDLRTTYRMALDGFFIGLSPKRKR